MFQLSDFNLRIEDLPRGDTIIVLPLAHANRTRYGIVTTEKPREKPLMAIVLAAGPGSVSVETGRPIPVLAEPGQFVKIPHFAGMDDEAEDEHGDAVGTVIMRDHEVLAYRPIGTFELEIHQGDPRRAHLKGLMCPDCLMEPRPSGEERVQQLREAAYGQPGAAIDAEIPAEDESAQHRAPDAMPDAGGPSALIEEERRRMREHERAQEQKQAAAEDDGQ